MIRLARRLHLISGLGLAAFVTMFFFTGMVLVHHKWFPDREPQAAVRSEAVALPAGLGDEALRRLLAERYGLRGKTEPVLRRPDGSRLFGWNRPGSNYEVLVSAGADSVTVTTRHPGFRRTMAVMHRIHGYEGGALYDLWVLMNNLAGTALIVFAVTGVMLWSARPGRDRLGWVMLGLGCALCLGTVLYFLLTP